MINNLRKKGIITILMVVISGSSFAQWTTTGSDIYNSNSGNVGIGTSAPIATLHVSGSAILSNPSGGNYNENLRLPPANNDYSSIVLGATPAAYGTGAGQWALIRSPSAQNYMFSLRYLNTDYLNVLSNGSIGIGTTSPNVKFQVNSNNAGSGYVDWIAGNFGASTGDRVVVGLLNGVATIGSHNNALNAWSNLALNTEGGNVSIGTNDAHGYKLAVNGNAIATSVTVKSYANWPDYVFNPTYQLPTLTEVKTYIDQNHHLPEMPSAKEVADKGIDLGEMNRLLTKKVEELTLYLIEKDAKEKKQQKQIDELQKQMKDILAKLK